jgi:anti-sigma B factor antagonist
MTTYHFTLREADASLTIKINEGNFDASSVEGFRRELDRHWSSRIHSVKVDMQAVEFIDSSGIGALLSVQKRLSNGADPVTLFHPRPPVRAMLELLRLQRVFNVVDEDF